MSTYEALMVMISFGMLLLTLISYRDNNKKK
ncbi:putative holin-like toxin [Alkaliphilus crotonatoxidans]